jgi:hypothetical protein
MQKIEGDGLAFVHQAELWLKKELKSEGLKVDTAASSVLLKMWITISSSSAESKTFLVVKDYLRYTCGPEPFIYNHCL